MENWEKLSVYRVRYYYKDNSSAQAFFEVKEMAQEFAEKLKSDDPLITHVSVNKWWWQIAIEP